MHHGSIDFTDHYSNRIIDSIKDSQSNLYNHASKYSTQEAAILVMYNPMHTYKNHENVSFGLMNSTNGSTMVKLKVLCNMIK